MADNSSNNGVVLAIIIILLLAIAGLYYFMNQDKTTENTKIDVTIPSTTSTTGAPAPSTSP